MEESIRRAENLVRATNSTLAQMKFNLTFGNAEREIYRKISHHSETDKKIFDFDCEEELERIGKQFKSEANEMLSKMDKLFDSNQQFPPKRIQALSARDRIREINRKLTGRRGEQSKLPEIDESRMKLLSLIDGDDEFSGFSIAPIRSGFPGKNAESVKDVISREGTPSGGGGGGRRRWETKTNSDDREKFNAVGETSKEELKSKLLETREIVERGFQTARELTVRIGNMTRRDGKKMERSPISATTHGSNEDEPRESNRRCGKSESVETIKSSGSSRCARCIRSREKKKEERQKEKEKEEEVETKRNKEKKEKRQREKEEKQKQKEKEEKQKQKEKEEKQKEKEEEEIEMKREKEKKKEDVEMEKISKGDREIKEGRNRLLKLKRTEPKKSETIRKLNHFRLPSIHIKGGLQMQRIHSLEIRPDENGTGNRMGNTAVTILSHEEIEKEKEKKLLEGIEKENRFRRENGKNDGNRIECFNCGKFIRIRRNPVRNPKEIDNLLIKCRFDVFDPRIDEFVEKCARVGSPSGFEAEDEPKENIEDRIIMEEEEEKKTEVNHPTEAKVGGSKTRKIEELIRKLNRSYREEADELECNHQEFEAILRSLFKRIDESREFFNDCRLFSSLKKREEEEEEEEKSRKRRNLTATKPFILSLADDSRTAKETNFRNANRMDEIVTGNSVSGRRERKKKLDKKDVKNKLKSRTRENWRQSRLFPLGEIGGKSKKEQDGKSPVDARAETVERIPVGTKNPKKTIDGCESPMMDGRESSSASTASIRDESVRGGRLNTDVETKTENDYESDFEMESGKNDDGDAGKNVEKREERVDGTESSSVESAKKLPTITEVESESERKTFEERKTDSPAEKPFEAVKSPKREEKMEEGTKEVRSVDFERGIEFESKHRTSHGEEVDIGKPEVKSPGSKSDVKNAESSANSKSSKSSSTEVVASLKDVLAALKDQFERTQTLADKLTENVKNLHAEIGESKEVEEKNSKTVSIRAKRKAGNSKFGNDPTDSIRRESPFLESFRNRSDPDENFGGSEFPVRPTVNRGSSRFACDSDEEPSIGEIKLITDRKRRRGKVDETERSSNSEGGNSIGSNKPFRVSSERMEKFKMAVEMAEVSKSEEGYHSEGQVPSDVVLKDEQCSSVQSIGEVISESISEASPEDL